MYAPRHRRFATGLVHGEVLASVAGLPREYLHYALIVRGSKTLKVGDPLEGLGANVT